MAYDARVIPVMIASPGDVFEERQVVRDVVHGWNYIYSLHTGVVLMPVGWETHSSPELGTRPQELINSRVLKQCDLLIAVFWTRLGTPTGEADSGTVEEIRTHVDAGKPAMLYFSSKPVAPESIDPEQYAALRAFKEDCKAEGMIWEFENVLELRDLVMRQLPLCINENAYIRSLLPDSVPSAETEAAPLTATVEKAAPSLSEEAVVLLKAATRKSDGRILKIAVLGGRFLQAGGQSFGGEGGRESARWEYALGELLEAGLMSARGEKGQVFEVSHAGWELADTLPERPDL